MAPVQSRQLLMWSFPTALVLFSYLYYKRKKSFLNSDPGGISIVSSQVDADTEAILDSASICETVNSDLHIDAEELIDDDQELDETKSLKIADALKKVIRDLETAAPIPEISPVEELVEEVLQITDESILIEDEIQSPVVTSGNNTETSLNECIITEEISNVSNVEPVSCDRYSLNETSAESILNELKNCDWTASENEVVPDSTTKLIEEGLQPLICKNCKEGSDYIKLGTTKNKKEKVKKNKKKNQIVDINMFYSDNEKYRNNYKFNKNKNRKQNNRRNDYTCNSPDKLLQHKLEKLTMDETAPNKYNQNSQRDSANHSPAEAMMLASPTLSHCSDNHSEGGSSDSGKGCSEVVTPAGGSSLAGDHQQPIIYEFAVPQPIVGRLIGVKGHNLQDLRQKTHTNIYVKMHPETTKLKICAIEGTPNDVDSALALIRKKFPSSHHPDLTLDRLSPSDFNVQMKPDYFHLRLVENMNNDVIVSSLMSAGYMFLQQPTHPTYQHLCRLNFALNANYNSPDAPVMTELSPSAIVAAPAMGGWYRAQIVEIYDSNLCQVRFLDYGGFLTVECNMLRKIRADFLFLPFQAIECVLANVLPAGGNEQWSEEAKMFVFEITVNRVLQAQIIDYAADTGMPLVYLYTTYNDEVILINEELVKRGFAEMIVYPEEECPEGNLEGIKESVECENEECPEDKPELVEPVETVAAVEAVEPVEPVEPEAVSESLESKSEIKEEQEMVDVDEEQVTTEITESTVESTDLETDKAEQKEEIVCKEEITSNAQE